MEVIIWNQTRAAVEVFTLKRVNSPKPRSTSAHPIKFAGRYFPCLFSTMPVMRELGEDMREEASMSTAELRGVVESMVVDSGSMDGA